MAYKKGEYTVDPTGYDIKYLLLVTETHQIDLTYLMSELNIHEDMYSKCISGTIVFTDSLNLISNLPLMEGDLIKGHFVRKETDPYVLDYDPEDLKFVFEIVKINMQEKTKQDQQVISVSFVSSTWTDNLAGRVSKSYSQMPYSDMVKDIYNKWLTRGGLRGELPVKPINTNLSDRSWNIVIPNLKPYDAITFLSRRSFTGDAANFLFWEDRDAFNYKSFSELFNSPVVAEYSTASGEEIADTQGEPKPEFLKNQYLNIISMKRMGYHDISSAALSGMISNRLIRHDIFNKRVVDHHPSGDSASNYSLESQYDYGTEFGKLPHTDNQVQLIRAYTNDKMASNEGAIISICPDHAWQWDDQESFRPDQWVRQRRGQIAQLNFVKMQITTPGNLTRKVGDKILINVWSPEWKLKDPSDERPKKDSRFAGHYIITALRRKFTGEHFSCIMDVVRDDYVKLETDPIWEEAGSPDYGSRTSVPGGRGGV